MVTQTWRRHDLRGQAEATHGSKEKVNWEILKGQNSGADNIIRGKSCSFLPSCERTSHTSMWEMEPEGVV